MKSKDIQEGGDHYINFDIQPMEFFHRNKIPKAEGDIIQYVLRHRNKGGKEDLLKARHVLDMLMEFEYGPEDDSSDASDKGA